METRLPLMTSEQAASALGKSLDAFYKWQSRNPHKIQPAMVAGNSKLWNPEDVQAFIAVKSGD